MRLRWLLPLINVAADVILFVILIHAVDVDRSARKRPPPLWNQVYGHVEPGLLEEGHTPAPLVEIIAGTAPAALLASFPLPNGWRASSPFDVRWTALYILFALGVWHAVGRWVETGHPKLIRAVNVFLIVRLVSIPLSMSYWGSMGTMLSHLVLFFAWALAALYVLLGLLWSASALIRTQ